MCKPAVLVAMIAIAAFLAFKTQPPAAAAPTAKAAVQDIDGAMQTIKRTLKELLEKIENPKEKEAVLVAFDKLQRAFMDAKIATPPGMDKMTDAEKTTFLNGYREAQATVLKDCMDAEIKYVQGKAKEAKKLVTSIQAAKGKGHGKYKKD